MAFSAGGGSGPKSDMNVVPLIDILLVLLIIFMVTAPTPASLINVTLPQRTPPTNEKPKEPPPPVSLKILSSGDILLNGTPAPLSTLEDQFADITQVRTQVLKPEDQPKLEIDVDADAEYDVLAKVLARAKNAQMEKIAFVDQTVQ